MKVQIRRLLAATVFGIGLIWVECCVAVPATAKQNEAGLTERIDGIINQSSQKNVQYSIVIVKADSGEVVYSHNAKEAMVPASNMKVITTAAALKYLGPDYEFKTKVGLCGDTLVITGGGDPLLGDKVTDAKYLREPGWIFKDITAALKRNDITAIKDIIVDSSIFDKERVHPNWSKKELNRWYACEVSGLNFNDNCIAVTVKNIGGKVTVDIEPETGFIKITNEVVPITEGKSAKSAVGAYRSQEPNKISIKGKCEKQEGPFDVAIEKPAEFFGFLLRENLARAGIKVDGQILEKQEPGDCNFKELTEYRTTITDCLARCNKKSLNLAAESLFKTIAAKAAAVGSTMLTTGGKNGSWARGREIISGYMLELGIEKEEFYIDDGSGLSKGNRLSANAITKVLLDVYKGKNWGLYKDSLAIGGVEGTIGKYFKEEKYKGKVFGKTGNIAGVTSFSGICSGKEGEYIFSILANKTKGGTREAINDITKAIIDEN
jgi:D-alanyl-D-alanine carboxypeptidase/D-alanyl-D-alanine-endopeptidase (penicillin-binding protein 4)